MKSVILQSVLIEGYRSFVNPVSFNMDRPGISMVAGENGAGKSTMFDAMYWALYKENVNNLPLSKIPSWERLRPDTWRGTRVAVRFAIPESGEQYMIARHLNFTGKTKGVKGASTLMLFRKPMDEFDFEPEDMVADEQYKQDQQGYINRLIGINSNAFINSILFGQNMQRLAKAKPEEKRELFEHLFDMAFIPAAKETAKAKRGEVAEDIETKENVISNLRTGIEQNEQAINVKREAYTDQCRRWQEQVNTASARIKEEEESRDVYLQRERDAEAAYAQYAEEDTAAKLSESNDSRLLYTKKHDEAAEELERVQANLLDAFADNYDTEKAVLVTKLEKFKKTATDNKLRKKELDSDISKHSKALQTAREQVAKKAHADIDSKITSITQDYQSATAALREAGNTLTLYLVRINSKDYAIASKKREIEDKKKELLNIDKNCPVCDSPINAEKLSAITHNIDFTIANMQADCDSLSSDLDGMYLERDRLAVLKTEAETYEQSLIAELKELHNKKLSIEPNYAEDPDVKNLSGLLEDARNTGTKIEDEIAHAESSAEGMQSIINKAESDYRDNLRNKVYLNDPTYTEACKKELAAAADLETADKAFETCRDRNNAAMAAYKELKMTVEFRESKVQSVKSATDAYYYIVADKPNPADISKEDQIIKEHNTKIADLELKLTPLYTRREKLDWWVATGFGAGGMKAFIFNSGLQLLNKAVEKYASRLGVLLHFSVDLTQKSKPFITRCFKGEQEVDYNEFSGGQKARLDIATAFAMHDVVSATSSINLLIMDESFDGLDLKGSETIFDLIRLKAGEGRSVYIISHRENMDTLGTHTINVALDEHERSYIS